MVGKLEVITEGTIEALVTADQGQALEQEPIDTGLYVLSVMNTVSLQETSQQHQLTES